MPIKNFLFKTQPHVNALVERKKNLNDILQTRWQCMLYIQGHVIFDNTSSVALPLTFSVAPPPPNHSLGVNSAGRSQTNCTSFITRCYANQTNIPRKQISSQPFTIKPFSFPYVGEPPTSLNYKPFPEALITRNNSCISNLTAYMYISIVHTVYFLCARHNSMLVQLSTVTQNRCVTNRN